jgi:hypothetical protein
MQLQTLLAAFATLCVGGCVETPRVAPQEPAAPQATQARPATATPNAATGSIELVLSDAPAQCGPYVPFPKTCDPAWRVRIDLTPEYQQPGQYRLGPDLSPFSYRDAQGKSGGVWAAGAHCKNLGSHFVGTLQIVSIDTEGISGVLSGAGEADGPFRAQRCPACQGTGQACTSNAECCNDYCEAERCQP